MSIKRIYILFLIAFVFFLSSCAKVETIEPLLIGTWERVVFNHEGAEQWTFTKDGIIYVTLDYPSKGIAGDTINEATYELSIVNYSHGTLLNKNFLKVPAIDIDGFTMYKIEQEVISFSMNNTQWQIHSIDESIMIITTDIESGIPGGLVTKEFYKK